MAGADSLPGSRSSALVRLRWRWSGAWLLPVFAACTLADALIGHELPPSGDGESIVAAGLLGCFISLFFVVVLSRPLGALLRRVRADLPGVVARNYAGTAVVLVVTLVLLLAGLAHRGSIQSDRSAMADAVGRAQGWIGDRAPAEFRRNAREVNAVTIQPGSIYRVCVPSAVRARTYCVVVKTRAPFARSVTFAGYEPNSVFAAGTG